MFKKSILVFVAVVFFCQSLAQDVNEDDEIDDEILNNYLTVGNNLNELLNITTFLVDELKIFFLNVLESNEKMEKTQKLILNELKTKCQSISSVSPPTAEALNNDKKLDKVFDEGFDYEYEDIEPVNNPEKNFEFFGYKNTTSLRFENNFFPGKYLSTDQNLKNLYGKPTATLNGPQSLWSLEAATDIQIDGFLYFIKLKENNLYLQTSPEFMHNDSLRFVFLSSLESTNNNASKSAKWIFEKQDGQNFKIKNAQNNEYLYAPNLSKRQNLIMTRVSSNESDWLAQENRKRLWTVKN